MGDVRAGKSGRPPTNEPRKTRVEGPRSLVRQPAPPMSARMSWSRSSEQSSSTTMARHTPCLAPFTHREGRTRQLDTRGRPSSDSWRTAHCARRRQLCTSSLSSADVPHLQVRCSRRRAARPPDQVALLDAAHASYDADQPSAGMYSPASSLASVKRRQPFAGKHGDPKRRVPAEVLLDRHG